MLDHERLVWDKSMESQLRANSEHLVCSQTDNLGVGPAADIAVWQKRLQGSFRPDLVSLAIADDEQDLHPALASKEAGEQVRAYLCIGTQCLPAIDNLEQLITQLAPTP